MANNKLARLGLTGAAAYVAWNLLSQDQNSEPKTISEAEESLLQAKENLATAWHQVKNAEEVLQKFLQAEEDQKALDKAKLESLEKQKQEIEAMVKALKANDDEKKNKKAEVKTKTSFEDIISELAKSPAFEEVSKSLGKNPQDWLAKDLWSQD